MYLNTQSSLICRYNYKRVIRRLYSVKSVKTGALKTLLCLFEHPDLPDNSNFDSTNGAGVWGGAVWLSNQREEVLGKPVWKQS